MLQLQPIDQKLFFGTLCRGGGRISGRRVAFWYNQGCDPAAFAPKVPRPRWSTLPEDEIIQKGHLLLTGPSLAWMSPSCSG